MFSFVSWFLLLSPSTEKCLHQQIREPTFIFSEKIQFHWFLSILAYVVLKYSLRKSFYHKKLVVVYSTERKSNKFRLRSVNVNISNIYRIEKHSFQRVNVKFHYISGITLGNNGQYNTDSMHNNLPDSI